MYNQHTCGDHGNIYQQTHKIMTDGDTVLILPCDTQFVTFCHYNDNVSLSIQFHSECPNYININLGVHTFVINISPSATVSTQKLRACFLVRTLAHLRRSNASMHVATVMLGTKQKKHILYRIHMQFYIQRISHFRNINTLHLIRYSHHIKCQCKFHMLDLRFSQ